MDAADDGEGRDTRMAAPPFSVWPLAWALPLALVPFALAASSGSGRDSADEEGVVGPDEGGGAGAATDPLQACGPAEPS